MGMHRSETKLNKLPQTKEELKEQVRKYLKRSGTGDCAKSRRIMDFAVDFEGHFKKTDLCRSIVTLDLDKLVSAGFLNRICGVGKNKSHTHYYECTIGKRSHSHLQCTTCGELTEFDDTLIKQLSDQIAEHFEFERDATHFQLSGKCKKCKKRKKRKTK